jgi:signal transduction histidine kinase/ActR/RegA family two-component response regulator
MWFYTHLFGPFVAMAIPAVLFAIDPEPWPHVYIVVALMAGFWLIPFALKLWPSLYHALSIISICNRVLLVAIGCYLYGGAGSPFLAWLLLTPMTMLYGLGTKPMVKPLALAVPLIAVAGIYVATLVHPFPQHIPMENLVVPGLISLCGVIFYIYRMALYYADVVDNRSELLKEIERHQATHKELEIALKTAEDHRRQAENAQLDAEQANQAKTLFLARMSHELRTPLNAIMGYSELLLEDDLVSRSKQEVEDLNRIGAAGRHLLGMVNDMLDITRIEASRVTLYSDIVDMDQLLAETLDAAKRAAPPNGNQFRLAGQEKVGTILGDATKIRQSILNLLSNAAKFTKQGAIILSSRLYMDGDQEWLDISVSDTGIGIAEADHEKIFSVFTQAHEQIAVQYGGSGLGLSLSQNLCRLMGGSITLSSTLGDGATFTIHLPLTRIASLGTHAEDRESDEKSTQGKVLVADLDRGTLSRLETTLRAKDYRVVLVDRAESLIPIARTIQPDVILLSRRLDRRNDILLSSLLASDAELSSTPLITLTEASARETANAGPTLPLTASADEITAAISAAGGQNAALETQGSN